MSSRFLKWLGFSRKGAKAQRNRSLGVQSLSLRLCAFAGTFVLLLLASACTQQKAVLISATPQFTRPAGVLRVCADPNNLPFSNERGEGFENKIAELLAHDMGERVEYTWWAQRRGFFRNTLKAGTCDVVIGVPAGFEMALTTKPYYRSSYVFLSRKDRHLKLESLDDPALKKLSIGVQIIGDDFSNTPPAHALSRRHIITNVKGFTVYGDYNQPNPPARIVDAVAKGDVDVAIVWGPLAGYFAKESRVPLEVVPVTPQIDQPFLPFVFDISMGVRRGDQQLRDQVEEVLDRRRSEIDRILRDYQIPRIDREKGGSGV
jgi:quinoprotein dehydrogenase-associated probable ABC transporter substrate-binding protein